MNTVSKQSLEKEINPDVIEAELSRLLSERRFAGAPQMSAFLRYIVEQTLAGKADRIKAYSVGVDALGKPDTFDAQTDPSVRVLALRLRKTLVTVYSEASNNLATIELKVGTYVPKFYKPITASKDKVVTPSSTSVRCAGADSPGLVSLNVAAEQSREAFAVLNSIAIEPVCDSNTAAQHALQGGLPLLAKNPSNGNILKPGTHSVTDSVSVQWPKLENWQIVIGVTLLAASWQISTSQTEKNGATIGSLPLLPAAISYVASAGEASGLASDVELAAARPSGHMIYVNLLNSQPQLDRQLTHLLSSSFAQTGTVSVVRRHDFFAHTKHQFGPGEYQLAVSGINVEDEMRVDAQLISLYSGEMLQVDTFVVDGSEQSFSLQNLLTIESMAIDIVSVDGPLYQDYCSLADGALKFDCIAS